MTSANNFRALFGLARPKLPFNFNILFKAVAQHGIDGGPIGAILLYDKLSVSIFVGAKMLSGTKHVA